MKQNFKTLIRMFQFTKNCRVYYIVGLIFFTSQIFTANFIQALFLKWLSAGIISKDSDKVVSSIFSFGILFLLQLGMTLLGIILYNIATIRIEKDLKLSLYHSYMKQSQLQVQKRHSFEAINRLNTDSDLALECLKNQFALVVFSAFTIIGSSIVIFRIDYRIGICELLIGMVSFFLHTKYTKPMKSVGEKILESNENANKTLSNILHNSETIKVNNYNAAIHSIYKKELSSIYQFSQVKTVLLTYQTAVKTTFGWLSLTGIFILGIYFIFTNTLDFPSFIMLPTLCVGMTDAITEIGRQWNALQAPIAAAQRVFQVLDYEEIGTEGKIEITNFQHNIIVNQLTFQYEKEIILDHINLFIRSGEKVALIGESGSGKSTLLKIIVGIYLITPECLYLDDISIQKANRKSWLNQFAYVDQECKLFHMSIYENIKLGNPMATEEEIYKAAKMAGCHTFIEKLPDKYDTIVKEQKTSLSGGESQRICIARALVKNAPILIFDEFTSALDKATEQELIETIFHFTTPYTIILSTHNIEIAKRADIIYQIKNGSLETVTSL